jgi:2-iminobutanoate/2-iminopropanoate deaminase
VAKTVVFTERAPKPIARFSQGVRKGSVLALAGQIGVDPATGRPVSDELAAQTRQALLNLRAVLEAAGASFDDVVMVRVYLTDTSYFDSMNEVYNEFVSEPYPARTTIYCGLPEGLLVEIDALAVVD